MQDGITSAHHHQPARQCRDARPEKGAQLPNRCVKVIKPEVASKAAAPKRLAHQDNLAGSIPIDLLKHARQRLVIKEQIAAKPSDHSDDVDGGDSTQSPVGVLNLVSGSNRDGVRPLLNVDATGETRNANPVPIPQAANVEPCVGATGDTAGRSDLDRPLGSANDGFTRNELDAGHVWRSVNVQAGLCVHLHQCPIGERDPTIFARPGPEIGGKLAERRPWSPRGMRRRQIDRPRGRCGDGSSDKCPPADSRTRRRVTSSKGGARAALRYDIA